MLGRWLLRISLIPPLVGYVFLMAFMSLSQDRLLYLPDPSPPSADNLRRPGRPALAAWPADPGAPLRGYVSANVATTPAQRGTVLVFHGNAGSARDRTIFLSAFEPRGVRVILVEYPGYGGRDGRPSQDVLVADGLESLQAARAAYGDPIWLLGESLGAAVAAQVAAAAKPGVAGVVLITPWNNLPDLAQSIYWYLPARWLVRDRYDSRAALQGFAGPKAVLIAGSDQIVPPAHSQALYEALPAPKRLWLFPQAGHNDWLAHIDTTWWDEVLGWLQDQSRP